MPRSTRISALARSATVGLSEAQARERGIEVKVGKIPFRANGKAVATNQIEGFVKIVAGKEYGEVIGCQIIGHHATDLIAEIVLGRTLETTTAELGPPYRGARAGITWRTLTPRFRGLAVRLRLACYTPRASA